MVAITAFCPIIEDLPVLHVIDVAEFHLYSSHPVFPSRADGVFPSPKFDPNTNTRVDPAETVSRGLSCFDLRITRHDGRLDREQR